MKLSIVIPAYNEAKRIEKTLCNYLKFFRDKYGLEFEIIVVLNGCTDGTIEILKTYSENYIQIKYLAFEKAGKGFAILEGFKAAKGDLIGFTDADGSTCASEFDKIVCADGCDCDCVLGSRYLKDSIVEPKQTAMRRLGSRAFNFLVRIMFGFKIHDTQCGAKVFKKKVLDEIVPLIGISAWAFDIDLLYMAKRKGFNTLEVPIQWEDIAGSSFQLKKSAIRMFLAITRLRLVHSPFNFIIRFYDIMPEGIKIHHKIQ